MKKKFELKEEMGIEQKSRKFTKKDLKKGMLCYVIEINGILYIHEAKAEAKDSFYYGNGKAMEAHRSI